MLAVGLLMLTRPLSAQEIRTQDGSTWFVQEWTSRVSASESIQMEDMGGSVEIGPAQDGLFRVELQIPVGTRSRADALAYGREFALKMELRRGVLEVDGQGVPRGARYRVSIPRAAGMSIETDGGTLNIHDLAMPLRIDHAGGVVSVLAISGSVTLDSAGGDVDMEDIDGNAEVQSDGGNVSVEGVRGNLVIVTGGGKIEASAIKGSASITTAGGNIEVSEVDRDVRAVTSAGRIEASEIGGDADLTTGGGDIEASDIKGELTASSSGGDVEADLIKGRIRIEALAGDVELGGVRTPVRIIGQVGDVQIEVADTAFLSSGMLEVDLGHGDVWLLLPKRTNAVLQANIQEEGTIDIDRSGWQVEVLRTRGGAARQAEVRIGEGGGTIRITLRRGEIAVDHS